MMAVLTCLVPVLSLGGCSNPQSQSATAEQYPKKPINLIVPFAAGGGLDITARAMEKYSVKYLGQSIVVSNIPGGGGTLGWNELAGSKPDGYTIGTVTLGSILQPLYGPTRFHYPSAIEPLIQISDMPIVAIVRVDQPWNDINDLVKYVRSHPGEIKYGHPGLGSPINIVGEMFSKEAQVDIPQVPFQGDSESIAALLGGHVQLAFVNPVTIKEYVKSGKLKVLAVSKEQRLTDPQFANVPTFKEQGYNVVFSFWSGIGAPKGLPPEVRGKLIAGLQGIAQDPEFIQTMNDLGFTVEYLGSENFREKWITENERMEKVVVDTGLANRIKAQKK